MNRVALLGGFGWAGISVPVAMTIEYLVNKGYYVDIYFERNKACEELGLNQPYFEYENSDVIYVEECSDSTYSDENKYGIHLSKKDSVFASLILECEETYDWVIGFEPHGVIRAGLYALEKKIPYIYFSLEFHEKNDYLKTAEVFFAGQAQAILTQDKYRAAIIADLLDVPIQKCHGVFNSTIGDIIEAKSDYLRERFQIPGDKVVVLAVGSLFKFTGIDQIINSFKDWADDFVLVVHGWTTDDDIKRQIDEALINYTGRFFYSDELLPHSRKFDAFSSADIGLIYYEPVDLNLKYAAWSSGKFYDFARCGVPVIANDIPNMRALVEGNGCGVVFEDFNELSTLFHNIIDNYSHYRKSCHEAFEKYDFVSSFRKAIKVVEGDKYANS